MQPAGATEGNIVIATGAGDEKAESPEDRLDGTQYIQVPQEVDFPVISPRGNNNKVGAAHSQQLPYLKSRLYATSPPLGRTDRWLLVRHNGKKC